MSRFVVCLWATLTEIYSGTTNTWHSFPTCTNSRASALNLSTKSRILSFTFALSFTLNSSSPNRMLAPDVTTPGLVRRVDFGLDVVSLDFWAISPLIATCTLSLSGCFSLSYPCNFFQFLSDAEPRVVNNSLASICAHLFSCLVYNHTSMCRLILLRQMIDDVFALFVEA
jgi:hypothetical protein